jgi:REP element-mobilizing transposase RayT
VADTFAYCLLRNHFHLLVRIKSEEEIQHKLKNSKNFSASLAFSNFFNAYAKGINQAYGRTGSLFQHPFGRSPLSNFNPFERVVVYIHQNPQKHGFVQDFRDWKYSSYRSLLAEESTRLKRDEVFTWFGSRELFIKSHDLWEDNPESVQDL